jgi:dipeptidyl aminopeptidase/acylaminoacyl peptidase
VRRVLSGGARRRPISSTWPVWPVAVLLAGGCALATGGCVDHALGHPRTAPAGVTEWRETAVRGKLLIRLEWAAPPEGPGPLPTVIVHPEAGHEAREMRPVLRDLAAHGYLAVAADYRRAIRGWYRESLFTWRDPGDPRAVFDIVRAHERVDSERIGLLGFSQGGVYSLSIAALTGQAAAVVAYYPVTDFEAWLEEPGRRRRERWVFRLIRRHFREQSGARSEEEFRTLLARASPLLRADRIAAPVLLIHGDRDRSAGVEQSRRLAERLHELGREVELLEVPGAGHVFNFRNLEQAELAWKATLRWLDRHVRDHHPA